MGHFRTFFSLSFRPFFLFGSISAATLIPFWLLIFSGVLPGSTLGWQNPVLWHAHEMIFGFGTGIVAGFLGTATQNWTKIPGISGWKLGLLVSLWLIARILPAFVASTNPGYIVIDLAFPVLFTLFIAKYLLAPDQKRNWIIFPMLFMLIVGNLLVHLENLAVGFDFGRPGLLLGVNGLVAFVILIGGRVIPFFTRNAVGAELKTRPNTEIASYLSFYLFVGAELVAPLSVTTAIIAVLTGVIHTVRWSGWSGQKTLKTPVLWILHCGYILLIAGFFLKAVEYGFGYIGTPSIHAFTTGGIGITIFGMITRVSLGHTGRPIKPTRLVEAAYYFIVGGALIRILAGFLPASFYLTLLTISGAVWTLAFVIFIAVYLPILTSPRVSQSGASS